MDAARPLLIFDSGVGGLSVLAAIRRELPTAGIVYVADSAGFPYGTKSEAEIEARVPALLGRLAERHDPRLIVIACNTASTIALDAVRTALDLPIVGTVPAIKPASLVSRSRVIGVLGTPATVVQPYVDDLANRFAADCRILRHGSAGLVELAEAHLRGEEVDDAAIAQACGPLVDAARHDGLDTVVLACTHFPLVEPALRRVFGQDIRFVHGAEGIARRTAFLTQGQGWPAAAPEGQAWFTGPASDIHAYRPALARFGLTRIGPG